MPFQHILCAVDFSETSSRALDLAVELADKFGARLSLLHVYQPPAYALPDAGLVLPSPAELNETLRQIDVALGDWKSRAERLGAKSVIVTSEQGVAWQVIVERAQTGSCDLIVLGTHGRTGITRLMLGSVAERVVRAALLPVLTVHPLPTAK